jgi:hypothetical protein
MTSRAEHIRWCKERALAHVSAGDLRQAMTGFLDDLGKHDETKSLQKDHGPAALVILRTDDERQVREWIEEFAE